VQKQAKRFRPGYQGQRYQDLFSSRQGQSLISDGFPGTLLPHHTKTRLSNAVGFCCSFGRYLARFCSIVHVAPFAPGIPTDHTGTPRGCLRGVIVSTALANTTTVSSVEHVRLICGRALGQPLGQGGCLLLLRWPAGVVHAQHLGELPVGADQVRAVQLSQVRFA
jgi:hypothetical protein